MKNCASSWLFREITVCAYHQIPTIKRGVKIGVMRWADLLTRMEEMKGAYNVSVSQNSSCTYKRNIEALWRNHCYLGKAVSITYSERVCVAFGIQHAMRMRHSVISDLSGSAVFFHISQMARCSEKKLLNIKCVF